LALAHVYGQPPDAVAISDKRLTNKEAEKIARLIARLPELVELEKDRNRTRSRRKHQPLRFKPVTIGDLIRECKLLEVQCGAGRRDRPPPRSASIGRCRLANGLLFAACPRQSTCYVCDALVESRIR
jgi:hypothetical protein